MQSEFEAESQKQQMLSPPPPPSILMKPFPNLFTLQPRGRSVSSTRNPYRPGDGNHMTSSRPQTRMTTRSKTKTAADVPVYSFHLEKTKHDTMNIKENVHIHNSVKPIVNGKGKEIYVTSRHPSMENTLDTDPLFGSKFEDNMKAVVVSSAAVDIFEKHQEKEVVTPISFGAMNKAKGSRFQSLRRTWSEVEGAEDELQTKASRYPLPNNKKRKCSSKGSFKNYVTPRDFFKQQNAYFKEIDEYELIVEEVE